MACWYASAIYFFFIDILAISLRFHFRFSGLPLLAFHYFVDFIIFITISIFSLAPRWASHYWHYNISAIIADTLIYFFHTDYITAGHRQFRLMPLWCRHAIFRYYDFFMPFRCHYCYYFRHYFIFLRHYARLIFRYFIRRDCHYISDYAIALLPPLAPLLISLFLRHSQPLFLSLRCFDSFHYWYWRWYAYTPFSHFFRFTLPYCFSYSPLIFISFLPYW